VRQYDQTGLLTIGEAEEVATEGGFAEGDSDEAVEAVEAFPHGDGMRAEDDAGGGGEAEHDQTSRR
jgi:hypothetical protein